jgi:hypothetical protein
VSDWLNRKDVCQRCFSGIDNDGDGNCATCAGMDDERAAWMKKTRLSLEMEPVDKSGWSVDEQSLDQ